VHVRVLSVGKDNDDVIAVNAPPDCLRTAAVQRMCACDLALKLPLHTRDFGRKLNCPPRRSPSDLRGFHVQANLDIARNHLRNNTAA
jgi:hypothetical protein